MNGPSPHLDTGALIIGAGPAGLFQAFQLGLLEIPCRIVDALPHAGGQCVELYGHKPIYDIPGTPVTTGAGLAESLLAQIAPFQVPMHLGEQVDTLQREQPGNEASPWLATTSAGTVFRAQAVVIAAGVGAFVPKRLAVEGAEAYEGRSLFYHPSDLSRFAGQSVVVHGGEDAAVEAALGLVGVVAEVTLLHRRDVFRADEALLAALRERIDAGGIRIAVGQPSAFDGSALTVDTPDGASRRLALDALVVCQGISPRLGAIADWGLELERKQIPVDTQRFQTREPGLYAVGDINTYPGKRKLIVSAFHEATLAAWAVAERVFDGKVPPLQYTTTSTRLRELLGAVPPR
ncbi:NAD(P)/FAD-dependent oxidoreductase [Pseudacidovorax intermedius]|uniref:Ferredoxin--NADP reductase n=1 Tax=Pseudacidovorax intermedius TaxID=433924 RepID=A0A147H7H8_9BURK|nr:NAD(P)/FAD-dependent oxidoreductase [Pseudacidovorax intermedius]KTT25909.1 ferredoxin-NADP reductase [Pseudacidovorax intermedius]